MADWNEILSEASLGQGKGFSRFWFKLYFNCYKYTYMKTENTKYPGSDKKPKACLEVISWVGFDPDRIRTLVSMATDSSHRVIMGKTASSRFLECF